MKKQGIAVLLTLAVLANSSNVAMAAEKFLVEERIGEYVTQSIELDNKKDTIVEKILEDNGLKYYPNREYEKIVVLEGNNVEASKKYKGQKYRIVYQYYNRPIKEVKKKPKTWRVLVGKAINVAIGFAKPYVWVPATVLGIDFSKVEEPGPDSYIKTTIYTHMTEKCFQFVTKGHKAGDWANYGICRKATIEDTTLIYRLIDKKKKRYKSQTGTKVTVRKTPHFDNNKYMLKKAYAYWKESYANGYQEYIQ